MVVRCSKEILNIHGRSGLSEEIAAKFDCSPLQATMLELRGVSTETPKREVDDWLSPDLAALLERLDLGDAGTKGADIIRALRPSSNVIVYGDYDVDGISATSIAMELVFHHGANVRYFIPHRFRQGYGFHREVAFAIARRGCDLVIVVDCGSCDEEAVSVLRKSGVPVLIFDHHLVENAPARADMLLNPQIAGDEAAKSLCAAGVVWSWIWQNGLLPEKKLQRMLDVVALATVADCVSLSSPLNRAAVREGLNVMRNFPRQGLNILMERLNVTPSQVDTRDLSMKVIPCLNAAGRIYLADLAVDILFPNRDLVYNVTKLIALNHKRRDLSAQILQEALAAAEGEYKHVLSNESWAAGVLSSVASRICGEKNMPVALVGSVGDVLRGTLRMPPGGDAVGVLKELAPFLNSWGGHRLAAGFSVKREKWEELREKMEEKLSQVRVTDEKEDVMAWSPVNMDLNTWEEAEALGPFGMGNPSPMLYVRNDGNACVKPLGKDGKHVKIELGGASLLGFFAADMLNGGTSDIDGWVYKPRQDTYRNVTSLQFVLEKMVTRRP